MTRLINISGVRYGKLVALERIKRNEGDKHTKWLCRCDCGQTSVTTYINLKAGNTKSCGCNRKPHGMTETRAWRCWHSMMTRCIWKSDSKYNGVVSVSPEWHDFTQFYKDMGDSPSDKHTLDRIDNSHGYEMGNVRWATSKQQSRNKSNNNWITHNGQTKVITDWAVYFGVTTAAVRHYIKRHGSLDGYHE